MSTDTGAGADSFQPSTVDRAHANHLDAFRGLARVMPTGRIEEDFDAVYVRTELPAADFNAVYVTHRPTQPDRFVDHVQRFFEGWNGPWKIGATPQAAPAVEPAAGLLHLAPGESVPLMILDPLEGPPVPLPAGVTLDRIEDEDTLRTYFLTGACGNGAPEEAFAPVAGNPDVLSRVLEDADWTNYLASLDGRPVATVLRYTTHRVADIYFVSTLPEFRGRGIGGAITLGAARDGLLEGSTISGLQATSMGYPVYRRIGYRVVYRYAQWASGRAQDDRGGPRGS